MGLPAEVLKRIPDEGDWVGLKMLIGSTKTDFYFKIEAKEGPNDLGEFSLGAAASQATAGTGWDEIQDANSRYLLEPEFQNYLYLVHWGVTPSIARIYRQYPAGVDRGSLLGTRAVGDASGWIDGVKSPAGFPSPLTEMWILKGTHPAFNGYHPYTEPGSITVRMNFYLTKFYVGYTKGATPPPGVKVLARTMGGITLFEAPQWLR